MTALSVHLTFGTAFWPGKSINGVIGREVSVQGSQFRESGQGVQALRPLSEILKQSTAGKDDSRQAEKTLAQCPKVICVSRLEENRELSNEIQNSSRIQL